MAEQTPLTQLEQTLAALVAFQSTTDNIAEISRLFSYVKQRVSNYGFTVHEYEDDGHPVMLLTTQPGLQPKVLFVAHADVVPASGDMFTMRADSANLYGRGVWDMKFAIAGIIELSAQPGAKLSDYNFGILLTSDEETRNNNVAFALKQGISAEVIVLLDGGNNWQLEQAAKGAWTVELRATGTSAHGSRPWEGDSASIKLIDALGEVRSWFKGNNPDGSTLNISRLNAGDANNTVPSTATACLDMRFKTESDREKTQQLLEALAKEAGLQWKEIVHLAAVQHDLTTPYHQAFKESAFAIAAAKSDGLISLGASEASSLMDAGIPCIVSRPTGGGHHADDEWVNRASLAQLLPILDRFLNALG